MGRPEATLPALEPPPHPSLWPPVCPTDSARVRLPLHLADPILPVNPILSVVLTIAALTLAAVSWHRLRRRRQREMHLLLDAADALEARLRAARAEIEAVTSETEVDPVRDAMREMLRQRLWLREQGTSASVSDLRRVRASIDEALQRIERQLSKVHEARAQED